MTGASQENQPRARRGRKYGEVRASTEEYARLVGFLRRQMDRAGLRQVDLIDATALQKSTINERLQGSRKLDLPFIEAVVTACTEAPHLFLRREKGLAEARRLWSLAQTTQTPVLRVDGQPAPIRNAAIEAQRRALDAQGKVIDLQGELIRKQEQVALTERARQRSEQALFAATALAGLLSAWVIVLADEVEQLTRQREQSMQIRPPDLSRLVAVDAELALKAAQQRRTSTELGRAEQERDVALAVLTESITRARGLHRDVLRLRQAIEGVAEAPSSAAPAAALDTVDAPNALGGDIEEALTRAEGISELISDQLRGALTDLGESPGLPPALLSGTENGPASANVPDNPWWWDAVVDVPSEIFAWAEETAVELLQDRDPHDPRLAETAADRPVPEALLLADTLTRHQWAEGAARLHLALALTLDLETLANLVPALLKGPEYTHRPELGTRILLTAVMGRCPSDALHLHNRLWTGDPDARALRTAFAAMAGRPREDVTVILREQLADNPRYLTHSPFLEAIVRHWPAQEVMTLMEELADGPDDMTFVWSVFIALRSQPAVVTELLLRLWIAVPRVAFDEMLPSMYGGELSDQAAAIAALHRSWPPPLDTAARELAAKAIPLIVRRTSLDGLEVIGLKLARTGIDPEKVFAPYQRLFQLEFGSPAAPVFSSAPVFPGVDD